jgi:hypothetical protein
VSPLRSPERIARLYNQCSVSLPSTVPSLHAGVQPQRKTPKDAATSDYVVTDEKAELVEEDEDDEDLLEDGGTFRLGQQDEEFHDFSSLKLKDDAHNRQAELARSQAACFRQYASGMCQKCCDE